MRFINNNTEALELGLGKPSLLMLHNHFIYFPGFTCKMKTLVVFDFDDTLIDDNSDTWVVR